MWAVECICHMKLISNGPTKQLVSHYYKKLVILIFISQDICFMYLLKMSKISLVLTIKGSWQWNSFNPVNFRLIFMVQVHHRTHTPTSHSDHNYIHWIIDSMYALSLRTIQENYGSPQVLLHVYNLIDRVINGFWQRLPDNTPPNFDFNPSAFEPPTNFTPDVFASMTNWHEYTSFHIES